MVNQTPGLIKIITCYVSIYIILLSLKIVLLEVYKIASDICKTQQILYLSSLPIRKALRKTVHSKSF